MPMLSILSCGNPKGACGLLVTSFQRQPAALARAWFSKVGEKVWFQISAKASLICE